MRCASCLRNIAAGAEAAKMVVEYEQADGTVKVHGHMMPDGPLSTATGRMLRGLHGKCWWIAKKREARGDAVTGRVVPTGITGYNIDTAMSGEGLAGKVDELRELAISMNRGIGDPQVTEAYIARQRGGGPYVHQHHYRLDMYQLLAHLVYAHGHAEHDGDPHEVHARLHARQAHNDILTRRDADGETARAARDWRTQFTAEIKDDND